MWQHLTSGLLPIIQWVDLTYQLKADQWEILEFPAILPSGRQLWPEYWSLDELEKVKLTIGLKKWNAQWQQQPTNDEGAILKREWWRKWKHDEPPECDYILQTLDTAYSKKETADFSVIATWTKDGLS